MTKEYNHVLKQEEARKAVKDGVNIAVDLIAPTLGAKSRRVIIDKEYGEMDASDDGTTILDAIKLEDTRMQQGVKMVQESSRKTNTDEGDGTTTTAVILRSLVNDLLKEDSQKDLLFKKESGSNLKVRKELQVAMERVIKYIDEHKIDISSKEQLIQIGKVSANSDEIGNMLADIFDELGKDGAVNVQEGTSVDTSYEIVKGMSFDSGWLAQQFVTDPDREEAILQPNQSGYVNVLITQGKIQDIAQMQQIGALFQAGMNDLLIIADDVSGIPLNSLIQNKLHQIIRTVAVKAPHGGSDRIEFLEDLCAATGATLIDSANGPKFEEITMDHLGKAKLVVVSSKRTTILSEGRDTEIDERAKVLEGRIEREASEYEKRKLQDRLAKLRGGVGNIKVGGATPLEIKDRKAKITDAVSAVKSALHGGVSVGGGTTLLLASSILDDKVEGEAILKRAIAAPFRQIMENADMSPIEMQERVLATGEGFNVETEQFGNMIEMGVIDPANVVKSALKNAVSTALIIANLGGSIAIVRDDKKHDEQ